MVVVAVVAVQEEEEEEAAVAAVTIHLVPRHVSRQLTLRRRKEDRWSRATHGVVAAIGTAVVATGDNTQKRNVLLYMCNANDMCGRLALSCYYSYL